MAGGPRWRFDQGARNLPDLMVIAARTLLRVIFPLVVAGALLSCAGSDPEAGAGRVQSGISGGEPDSADTNVFLVVSPRGSDSVALCTGSLIAPNLLLTARHCVSDVSAEIVACEQTEASAPFPASVFGATNVENQADATSAFRARSIAVPTQGSVICGFDLALITLSSNVPSSVATPLVPRIDQPVSLGESYRAVGYGQVSADDAGLAGVRMARAGLKVTCPAGAACGSEVESSEFVGGTGICSGDSGGPALDSNGRVIGVASRSASDCSGPVYGAVASWRDWIVSVARQAAAQGNYPLPTWVTTGATGSAPADASDSTSAGTGDGASTSVLGDQGDRCSVPADCLTTYGCYSPNKQATNAYCAAFCTASASCRFGTHCDSGVGVCVSGSPSTGDASCAIASPGRSRRSSAPLLALAAGLICVSRRRSRRASGP